MRDVNSFPVNPRWAGTGMSPQARKITQRERIVDGMVAAANRRSYAGANVSEVIAEAGVSRPTFYEYFADRDDCFRATIEELGSGLLAEITGAVAKALPQDALAVAVVELVSFATTSSQRARFLTAEALTGGRSALDARDAAVRAVADAVAKRERDASSGEALPDVDASVVIGATFRLLARRLRRGGLSLAGIEGRLAEWVCSYQRPQPRHWERLAGGPVLARSAFVPDVPVQQMPDVLPPGRPRLAEEQIAENHRLRILYAAARLSSEQGYLATTVAQITRLAGVDGRVFYRHFADKQEAVAAAHEIGFQQVIDVTGRAFFSVQGWPERSWEAGRALTGLLEENPIVARVGFVEAYAIGAPTVQRIEDSHMAFMFFLQEGLLSVGVEPTLSREAMEAIIDAIFEIVYMQARMSEKPRLAEMLTPIMHIWLTPFMGTATTEKFIERQTPSKSRKREPSSS